MSKTKKLSKVLALVIMLALVIGVLPMGAAASTTPVYVRFFNGATQIGTTVSVTASSDNAYTAITAAISSLGSSVITSYDITKYGITSINGLNPSNTDSEYDAWLFTVDDKLSPQNITDATVSAGSVVTVFYTTDYRSTVFAYIVPDGAPTSGNAIAASNGDTIKYRVAASTADFNNLYSTILSTDYTKNVTTETYIQETPTVSGYSTVIPAYKRVVSSSGLLDDWRTATRAAYAALTQAQKNTLTTNYSSIVSDGDKATATMNQVNALAYIVAPYTRANSAELQRLNFKIGSDYLNIVQTATGFNGFLPDITAYTLDTMTEPITVNTAALSGNATVAYTSSGSGMSVTSAGAITFSASGTYTLTVTVTNVIDDNRTVTKSYTVTIPYVASVNTGVPSAVCGFLPIGQFARPNSFGWGGIYTDGTNVYGSTKVAKFTASAGGYTSTGVSLGMLGGYVQFELAEPLNESASRPYGIDFIVYGNPFNGNPEAGCVMVYGKNNGVYGWYNLAGSRHYQSDTQYYSKISYVRLNAADTSLNSAFTAAGIYWSTNYNHPTSGTVDAAITAATWQLVPNSSTGAPANKAWWPEKASNENYQQVWKMWTSAGGATIDGHVDGVYWDTSETTDTTQVITYSGIVRVQDDDQGLSSSATDADHTDFYRFGYADVRVAGSHYGKAINPYATLPSTGVQSAADGTTNCGGDGFDLSWAVDQYGNPVALTDVTRIRVYSGVLYNTGVFGETSTEICGLYLATGSGTGNTTGTPSVANINGTPVTLSTTAAGMQTVTIPKNTPTTVTITGYNSSDTLFLNGKSGTGSVYDSFTLGKNKTQIIRVIAKDNTTGIPYIGYFKLKGGN